MSEPRIKSGLINELFGDSDIVAFAKCTRWMINFDCNFFPLDPVTYSCHGAIVQSKNNFFTGADPDRFATFKNALSDGLPMEVQTIRFAQWRAELRMEKSGRVMVKRTLRVNKKGTSLGGSPVIMVLHPGLNDAMVPFPLDQFKKNKKFKAKGKDLLECIEEIEIGPEEFMNFVEVYRYWHELEQMDSEYL